MLMSCLERKPVGAHDVTLIRKLDQSYDSLLACYGSLEHVAIITLAPELTFAPDVIARLTQQGMTSFTRELDSLLSLLVSSSFMLSYCSINMRIVMALVM